MYVFLIICVCGLCVDMGVSAGVLRGQKRAWSPLDLELQMVMSHPNWGLLQEWQVLLTAESSSLTHKEVFMPVLWMLRQGHLKFGISLESTMGFHLLGPPQPLLCFAFSFLFS